MATKYILIITMKHSEALQGIELEFSDMELEFKSIGPKDKYCSVELDDEKKIERTY